MNDRFKFKYLYQDKLREVTDLDFGNEYITVRMSPYGRVSTELDLYKLVQCTGLKDKNGKLIYEGDIVNVFVDSIKPHYIPHVVIWDRKEWQLAQQNKNYKKCENCANRNKTKCSYCKEYFMSSGHTNFKDFYNGFVIGNIYENPELLEEQCANQLNKG